MVWKGGEWTCMPGMVTACRQSCVVAVDGGGLLVMGGEGCRIKALDTIQVFDSTTQTWHIGPPLPQPCKNMSAAVYGDLVFVMGGWPMDRAVWCANISDLTSAHIEDMHWRRLPDLPYIGSSARVVGGVLFAIGGSDGSKRISAIFALHPVNQKWQHVAEMPFECSYVDTVLLSGGRLLVVDGDTQKVTVLDVEGLVSLFPTVPKKMNPDERLSEEH
eukprot:Em0008g190a